MNPLHGAFLKLKRADQHIRGLDGEIRTFLQEQPYVVEYEPRRVRTEHQRVRATDLQVRGGDLTDLLVDEDGMVEFTFDAVEEVGVRVRIVKNDPGLWWGVLVGDVVHNLRSALDHLVWELTVKHSGPPPTDPPPRDSVWKKAAFPVTRKARDWGGAVSAIRGVDPHLRSRFESWQPFRNAQHGGQAETHPLWILQRLWNRDKHHAVNLTGALVGLDRIGSEPPESGLGELRTKIIDRAPLGPFMDGAEIARVEVVNPIVNVEALAMTMNSNLHFAFDVAFDRGTPAEGMAVMKVLNGLLDVVTAILADFGPELP
jgi:hypothetical protein